MKSASLLQHIGIAMIFSSVAIVNDLLFSYLLTEQLSAQLNISIIVFFYLVLLMRQSPFVAGRITLLVMDMLVLLVCLLSNMHILTLLQLGLLLIWLNRSILVYSSLPGVIAESGLCLLSVSVAYGLFVKGDNLIMIVWCLLLLQTLHCLIPGKRISCKQTQTSPDDNFDQALQSAENALKQLFNC